MTIDEFLEKLKAYKDTDSVTNIYRDTKRLERLRRYLEDNKGSHILLVGEAPGYKGCAKTGIPFTSDEHERSAEIIQAAIKKEFSGNKILLWNAFPFHPHEPGYLESNRKPTSKELEDGLVFLKDFLLVFSEIKVFLAVGRVAEQALKNLNLESEPIYIRHPSYGGKKECEESLHRAANN